MTRLLAVLIVVAASCSPGQLETEQEQQHAGGQGGSGGSTGSGGGGGSGGGNEVVPDAAMPDAHEPCVGGAGAAEDPMTGHCFLFFANQRSYIQAAQACQAMGYHLATLTTASEQTAAATLNGANDVWIGYSDASVEGTFRWITGEMSTYTNWATGEPNNGGGGPAENCTILDVNRQDQWDDRVCDNAYDYICERG